MNEEKETSAQEQDLAIEQFSGMGYDGMRTDDFGIPFLRVLQSNSPELLKGDPSYIKDAEAGMFMNSLTHELYGFEIELVPIKCEPIWLEFSPKSGDKRGEFKGRHAVNSIPVIGNIYDGLYTKEGNEIKETLVFYCFIKGRENELPICFSLTSSMIKHGKAWNALIYSVRTPSGKQAPYFSSYWKIRTVINQKDGNRWYNIGAKTASIERVSFVPVDVLKRAAETRVLLDKAAFSADFAQLEDDRDNQAALTGTVEY